MNQLAAKRNQQAAVMVTIRSLDARIERVERRFDAHFKQFSSRESALDETERQVRHNFCLLFAKM